MKKSAKLTALVLSFVLLLTAVGGTLAYLTAQDSQQNIFTVGNIAIRVDEKSEVTNGKTGNDKIVYEDRTKILETGTVYQNIMPGNTIVKQPTVTNIGNNAAYVRVVVEVENKGNLVTIMDEAIDQVFEDKIGKDTADYNNFYNTLFDGWGISYLRDTENVGLIRFWMEQREDDKVLAIDSVRVMSDPSSWQYARTNTFQSNNEKNNYYAADGIGYFEYGDESYYIDIMSVNDSKLIYVFYLKLEPQDTYTLFNGFHVPESFDSESLAFFDGLEVNVYADAIQTEGFADGENAATDVTDTAWYKAFDALNKQHPLSWINETVETA